MERAIGLGKYDFARETLLEMNTRFPNLGQVWGADDAELMTLLKMLNQGGGDDAKKFARIFTKDLVVILNWDTNGTDVSDLHVTDPNGEECYYAARGDGSRRIAGPRRDDGHGA